MKRIIGPPLLVLALSLVSACGDETGPTAPAATAISLSGAWTGTITYFADSDQRQSLCATERLNTVVSQSGAQVTAQIATSCHGSLELSGTIQGGLLIGALSGISQESGGRITGLVSSSRMEITTSRGRTAEPVAVNRIDLTR